MNSTQFQKQKDESIPKMLASHYTNEEIQDFLSVGSERISKVKKGFQMNQKIGRPSALTWQMIDYIETLSYANTRLTDGDITSSLTEKFSTKILKSTVARTKKTLGYFL
ncbi:hypothetical protein GPJ56_010717 [Histomonas meleagridis]|uniref:uncharacterized protein n=1 Tax=Histomonas meleagridis TaxID=135588 RepID=UPI003559CD44|nr:hypothetical protein GPJ56_010717 [Histomonas meleagridis]KAH0801050.1 hypothetical protein GO595_006085 [Histomonas meleagridis]